jgi:hypothetical protein
MDNDARERMGWPPVEIKPEDAQSEPIYVEGYAILEQVVRFSSCQKCHNSMETIKISVPDHAHSRYHTLYIGWCMSCRMVRAHALFTRPEWARDLRKQMWTWDNE